LYLAGAEHPDLIITDIDMPVLTGIEMIEQLRTQEESHDIPILVLTAFGKEAMGDSIRAGANRAIMKPAPLDRLITEVRELLAAADKKGFHMH
jgi:CheY-like chemotaxis protein